MIYKSKKGILIDEKKKELEKANIVFFYIYTKQYCDLTTFNKIISEV